MNADELRQMQAPIKAGYKENPETAGQTFHARGQVLPGRLACRITNRFGSIDAGLHPAAGGDGSEACAGDMLLEALVACAGVTFNVVATAMGVPYESAWVFVEADADFRGTLGIDKSVPVGVTEVRMRFEVDSPASDEQLASLLRMTERYCVVLQSLEHPPVIATSIVRQSSGPAPELHCNCED